ncbi:acetyl-CoA carboxylase biotin carboxylase subunit [Brucella pseudogrignonensis]|uniref:acetyl-CoA carboxylase biotin carboxylase subunit n=1 Tax=Brucella pseudogrignonensis TaxID=419475 RepID=UPI0007DA4F4F|nr:acetyl-CoA carboxylase biotin carboxylase subunit [Brucella pseudogrignonensis]ANG98708.1 acetyl-CoA carboxylase biotin carboxylase subunit [Brucella pseudogrignonensis]
MTLERLLIANRGEIATRIQRACRKLGITTLQIHSTADAGSRFVTGADESLCIGPAKPAASYLNASRIIAAARLVRADAIHPGYGFLSENAAFASRVEAEGMVFVGPTGPVIARMGDKIEAKRAMIQAGVPCVPGYEGPLIDDPDALLPVAEKIGFPVIIKAAAGGGGRGMRIANTPADLPGALTTTREEARLAFGDSTVYLEKFLGHPRHVEIQVLADAHGNAVWLGERDCSLQRRHQKVIEESPAPGISRDAIAKLGEDCAEACRRIGYRGAGTFEFLYQDGQFFFIEMNTRIQVEHPVTEMVTGLDLVEAQLRIARGDPLWFSQSEVTFTGHAIECRINAEHPETFLPSPGRISLWQAPTGEGLRVDSHCASGCVIPPHYDSMIGKLICHGPDRATAIARMQAALAAMRIEGIDTNLALHQRLLQDPVIRQGGMDIHYLGKLLEAQA